MTPISLMTWCGVVFVISTVVAMINLARMMKTNMRGHGILIHLLFGLMVSGSGMGLVGGFIWFLVDKYA